MLKAIIRNLLKPLSFLPAILLMYMIFSFSAQDGNTSAQLSYKVSYKIVEVAGKVLDADFEPWEIENLANRFHGPIRKIAHMAEYFALAVTVSFPLYVYGLRGFFLMIIAGLFCVAFACADEYHQSMVAGRSPSEKDVLIDSIGIFFGIIFTRIVGWTGRKTIFRPLAKTPKDKISKKNKKNQPQSYPVQNHPGYYDQENVYSNQPAPGYYNPQGYSNQPNPGYYNPQGYANQPNPGYYNPQGYSNQPNPGYYNPQGYSNQPNPGYYNPQVYSNQSNTGYYSQQDHLNQANRDYGTTQIYGMSAVSPMNDPSTSDRLSEDMSFKKLMHDLKDKKQTERHLSRKPKIDK